MINYKRGLVHNSWEPPEIDMEQVMQECRYIKHDPWQNICVLFERDGYIEVVVYNEKVKGVFSRFIVAPDYYWTLEEEQLFDKLVQEENVAFSALQYMSIYEKYSKQYPDWKLRKYHNKPLRLIDHIHHCQQKYSVKEILYKAGLDEIAARINLIDGYNLIGSSPADIFSGLNTRLLRVVNIPEGIALIQTEEKRQKMRVLQNKYSWIFNNKMNAAMCLYLDKLISEGTDFRKIAKKLKQNYNKLSGFWIESQYFNFASFKSQEKQVLETLATYEGVYDLTKISTCNIRPLYRYLIKEKGEWDKKIKESNSRRNKSYEWEDEKFSVRFPRGIEEFVLEAIRQQNCLLEYVEDYVDNNTDILLLRKSDAIDTPFVTIEICEGEITQALVRGNKLPDENIQDWIKMYAKRVGVNVGEECFSEENV